MLSKLNSGAMRGCASSSLRSVRAFASKAKGRDPVIVSYARTPIGTLGGALSSMSGPALGSVAIRAALERAQIKPEQVQEAYLGNVVSAGIGQAPTRQAVLGAGLPESVPCTTVNKVCASGMKSIAMASQSIMAGSQEIMLAGGFESMSNIPYYLPKARQGYRLGDGKLVDGLVHDGLWDPYNNQHMGVCGEVCAKQYGISREEQDEHAISSYTRAAEAVKSGRLAEEIAAVAVPQRRGDPKQVTEDEEYKNINLDKLRTLRPAFQPKDGTVTAANASKINDGAAALVIMSADKAESLNLTPLARILGFADAAQAPVEFTTTPSKAVPLALKNANISLKDVDYHEINEAFSVVALANMKLMDLDPERVNVNGGAVALGHPIGMSGARIVGSLIHILRQRDATIGCASICNGGGGAGAMVIERMN